MRVALTGAEGFTGHYVIEELVRRGLSWVALDCDITDPAATEAAVEAEPFDSLIHLAAIAFVAGSDWRAFYDVNQTGTFNLLDAVARHRPSAACLLASSAQVYGPGLSGLIGEDTPPNPANHYALSKYAMERGAALWDALDIRIVRPFNYTGVGQEDRYLIPKLVGHFARRAPEISLGNTHVKRDFGDVRSVARAYCGLAALGQGAFTANIATGRVHSIDEILDILSRLTGHSIAVKVDPAFVRPDDVDVLGGDPARLQSLLPDWEPAAIEDTLAWMLEDAERRIGS